VADLEITFRKFLERTSKNHQCHKKFQQYPFGTNIKYLVNENKASTDEGRTHVL